jgi:hypothetical protein
MNRFAAAVPLVLGWPMPPPPPPPLGALASVPRVRLEVARDRVVATEEVDLPKGDWRAGDLDFFVAFGAPGAPEAFDAHLLAVADGALEPLDAEAGEKLSTERASHRPSGALELLGPSEMAGVVVHVGEASFRRALTPGGMAALRLRSLLRLPEGDAEQGREVLVRLGSSRSTPLTLGRVQVTSADKAPPVARAEARLCGPDADPWPLAVSILPPPAATPGAPRSPVPAPIAPVLAVRHVDDNLCIRVWTASAPGGAGGP